MFRLFLAFLVFHQKSLHQVDVFILLAFFEFLHLNKFTVSNITNYSSALKSKMALLGFNITQFEDLRVQSFMKALQKQSPMSVRIKPIFDIQTLKQICNLCDSTYQGQVFKVAYLLGFFAFLRLSNLCPHSAATFDMFKHLTRGDVFCHHNGMKILIKWSKTMQMGNQAKVISIPLLNSEICPVLAIRKLLAITPGSKNAPLFQFKEGQVYQPLIDTRVRKHLKNILQMLKIENSNLTFHAFRRSGATFAFQNNAALQNIQQHGTWTSECVWRYISDSTVASTQVSDIFRSVLSV